LIRQRSAGHEACKDEIRNACKLKVHNQKGRVTTAILLKWFFHRSQVRNKGNGLANTIMNHFVPHKTVNILTWYATISF
jgi:hypothetical protein